MNKTCATCAHYHPYHGEPKGQCWLNPPEIFQSGFQKRPEVKAGEACGHHADGEPVVKEKVNPDTPGQAARAARKIKQATMAV